MVKKILGIAIVIGLVFALGIFLENGIRNNFSKVVVENKAEKVEVGQLINNRETGVVKRVLDGDTIELVDGRRVRYIGINSPEMTDKRKDILCFANMAKEENQRLVLGKTIEMEKDISDKDKYDRLLRYVWIDNKMVNEELVQNGYAKIATYPPDVKYKDIFLEASKLAPKLICNKI